MARRTDKCTICRREGEKLYLKGDRCFTAKCAISRRPYAPGQHGPTSRTKLTPFGVQLREKQKAKNTYGVLETQFRTYFDRASRKLGNTGEFLVRMLELRLDSVIYRSGLGRSRAWSRQAVTHGHVLVNGKRVNVPSYQLKAGDVVSLSASGKARIDEMEQARMAKHQVPAWLSLEAAAASVKVLHVPAGDELKQNFDPKLIVEFYSR
jgi:small subunit ribosomal protein S4